MASDAFPVIDVSSWEVTEEEAIGVDEKEWLRDPESESAWLFKPVVEHPDRVQGEDWSEKLASELGQLLGMPCARIQLAVRVDRRGALSLNLTPAGWEMHTGRVVLSGIVPDYRPGEKGRLGHSLANISRALQSAAAPPGYTETPHEFSAFDVFAGYLMFDAWIANRDRHDENWALLRPPSGAGQDRLCGSYDHASSLGFNILDDERVRRLREGTVEVWARRGTAYRFEHDPSTRAPTLVAMAGSALASLPSRVREYWLSRLHAVDHDQVARLVHCVPGLSEPTRRFVVELLSINRRRVLDEC